MSGRPRCNEEHQIRARQTGDRRVEGSAGTVGENANNNREDYVLLCNGTQVGAMDGSLGMITLFEIFPEFRGSKHSEIFLELIVNSARQSEIQRIITTPARDDRMKRALIRCGFTEFGDDEYFIDL